jgi:hypothetical protein
MERTRMKRQFSVRWGLLAGAAACAAVAAMPGCELIVDFDRTKIPLGDASDDATVSDDGATAEAEATVGDATSEGSSPAHDGSVDAGPDGSLIVDGSSEGSAVDAAESGTPETGSPESGAADAPSDAPPDQTTPEAAPPEEAGPDGSDT